MWKLYVSGREVVAIKTTVASLVQLLSFGRELKLGRVVYEDIDDSKHPLNVFIYEYGNCTGRNVRPYERYIFRKAFFPAPPIEVKPSVLLDKPIIGVRAAALNPPAPAALVFGSAHFHTSSYEKRVTAQSQP